MMSNDPSQQDRKEYEPDWAHRARHIEHKPEWVDAIPHELWELGGVFFPIPNAQKAWEYPHHLDKARYGPDDEKLNAYLESNANYGIACANELVVVDIDEIAHVEKIKERLPDTVWQVTGSRTGVHLFFKCEGLNSRIILRVPFPWDHMAAHGHEKLTNQNFAHIGEVKCDPHGYVVGPGSKHPSGNEYGPLYGDEIASITESELREALDEYIHSNTTENNYTKVERDKAKYNGESKYSFYNLEADDVVPWLEADTRVPHPVHGSDTGTNFMKSSDREVFICWRHDHGTGPGCALNPQQLLAVMATGKECDIVRRNWRRDSELHYKAWMEAVEQGLVSAKEVPYKIAKGYAVHKDHIIEGEELQGKAYWDTINAVRCVAIENILPEREDA